MATTLQQKTKRSTRPDERGEVLVAIINSQADLGILQDQGWYRIPVASRPKRWPPKWLAFYQTKIFGDEAYRVNYFGRVARIRKVRRRELFPYEMPNPKTEREYYQVFLQRLEPLSQPIPSTRPRRIVFIPTTWAKLESAVQINDLFDDSPLEDIVWAEFKRLQIAAERQFNFPLSDGPRFLDFAVFCDKGNLNIETDGDTWHADPKRIPLDNQRDNGLHAAGWQVLRYNGLQIRESLAAYCIPEITKTINRFGGPSSEGFAPRKFLTLPEGEATQLALFEEAAPYDLD